MKIVIPRSECLPPSMRRREIKSVVKEIKGNMLVDGLMRIAHYSHYSHYSANCMLTIHFLKTQAQHMKPMIV